MKKILFLLPLFLSACQSSYQGYHGTYTVGDKSRLRDCMRNEASIKIRDGSAFQEGAFYGGQNMLKVCLGKTRLNANNVDVALEESIAYNILKPKMDAYLDKHRPPL